MAPSVVAAQVPACSGGVVALTFDDGPTPETNAVLDELKINGLKATFFVLGWNVEAYPDVARRIVREGHQIANHSWDHKDLTTLTAAELDHEIKATNDIIRQVTGVTPKFARPPYGSTNEAVHAAMVKYGLREVIWSLDSWDWAGADQMTIFNQLTMVPPGGTFLMHDWAPNTLATIGWFSWYFNDYWAANPICAGRLERTTKVQPVMDWPGLFYFAQAVR